MDKMQRQNIDRDSSSTEQLVKITDELLKSDQTFNESQRLYSEWANTGTYDEMLYKHEQHYGGPYVVLDQITKLVTNPEDALVLDLGSGTGILAQMLLDKGFKNIHGLDPNKEFNDIARGKGLYQKLLEQYIGLGAVVDAENDTYDTVISIGAMGPGHIPCDAFHEVIRITKPGGYFISGIRESYLTTVEEYKDRLLSSVDELEKEGKWKKLVWERYPNHFNDRPGILMVFQIS